MNKRTSKRGQRPVGLYLWQRGFDLVLVDQADDVAEAVAIAEAFYAEERISPTGGRLLIDVHQKCTKTLKTA